MAWGFMKLICYDAINVHVLKADQEKILFLLCVIFVINFFVLMISHCISGFFLQCVFIFLNQLAY